MDDEITNALAALDNLVQWAESVIPTMDCDHTNTCTHCIGNAIIEQLGETLQ